MRLILETGKTETDETEVAKARVTKGLEIISLILAAFPTVWSMLFPKPVETYSPIINDFDEVKRARYIGQVMWRNKTPAWTKTQLLHCMGEDTLDPCSALACNMYRAYADVFMM